MSDSTLLAREQVQSRNAGQAITEAQIEKFVAAFYLALDLHLPPEMCAQMVADEGLKMIFPEKTLIGMGDFLAWYGGGTYSDGEKAPGVINIYFDENHYVASVTSKITGDQAEVDILVGWQASKFDPPSPKSRRIAMDATQKWTVRKSSKNPYGLEIVSYNAMSAPINFTPGFARL
jgi:hypothetical protein